MAHSNQQRKLGASELEVSALGLGTNKWGIKRGEDDARTFQTFQAALDAGLAFFDTAEVYTNGESERLLGEYMKRDKRPVMIASKFAPLLKRLPPRGLLDALDASLSRLNRDSIDLYYLHWPYILMRVDDVMDMMAQAVRLGKIRAVGVSNFSAKQMQQAAARLARYDIPLASNEVHYSLLHRLPETNGVLEACRELNVALIAHQPLEGGQLKAQQQVSSTEVVSASRARSSLLRSGKSAPARPEQLSILQATLSEIALTREKTVGQVALNWLLQRDEHIIPIPGSTSASHIAENVGALDWQLSEDEFAILDKASQPWKE